MPPTGMVLDSHRGTQSLWEQNGYGSNTGLTLESDLRGYKAGPGRCLKVFFDKDRDSIAH